MATPRARQGRRDPALLQATGDVDGPQIDLSEPDQGEDDEQPQHPLLFPGEELSYKFTLPVVLDGSYKESYVGGEVKVMVQEHETFYDASGRAREAVLRQLIEGIEETEQAIARLSQIKAGQNG